MNIAIANQNGIVLKEPKPGYNLKDKVIPRSQLQNIIPSFRRSDSTAGVDFINIFRIFTQKHSKKLHIRQIDIIQKLLAIYKDGVPLSELSNFSELLLHVKNVIMDQGEILIPWVTELVKLLRNFPGLKSKEKPPQLSELGCKDLDKTLNDTSKLLSVLGDIMTVITDEEFIHHNTAAIYRLSGGVDVSSFENNSVKIQFRSSILTSESSAIINQIQDFDSSNSQFLSTAAEKSNIIETLLYSLSKTCLDTSKFGLIKCLKCLSKSKQFSLYIAQEKYLQLLLDILEADCEKDTIVFSCIDVFWNILNSETSSKLGYQFFSKTTSLLKLKNIFNQFVKQTRQIEKQKRNEIIVLCSQIIENSPESIIAFKEIKFSHLLFNLLTGEELQELGYDQNGQILRFVDGMEDFELKRILSNFIQSMIADEDSFQYLVDNGIIKYLNILLGSNPTFKSYLRWKPHQLSILQISAFSMIQKIIPKYSKEYRVSNGPLYLVNYFAALLAYGDVFDRKRIDLERIHISLTQSCLLTILKFSEAGVVSKKMLGQLNIFKHLLKILSDKGQTITIWRQCLMICSSLCQKFKENKQIFGDSGGVEIIIPFLKAKHSNAELRNMLVLATVECVWGAVSGNLIYEDLFIHHEGIFLLVELLNEHSDILVTRHVLGCLLDLLENPKAIEHALSWTDENDPKIAIKNTLLKLWSIEETNLGIKQGEMGSLVANVKFPLKSQKPYKDFKDFNEVVLRPSVQELQLNFRAKIYSIFCKIGFDFIPGTLSCEEQVKLSVITKYLDLKVGEVWDEITQEFEEEGLRPITPDIDCIKAIELIVKTKVSAIILQQKEIIQQSKSAFESEEKVYFDGFLKEFAQDKPIIATKPKLHKWRLF